MINFFCYDPFNACLQKCRIFLFYDQTALNITFCRKRPATTRENIQYYVTGDNITKSYLSKLSKYRNFRVHLFTYAETLYTNLSNKS